jgi:hypothetical protein
MWETLTGSAMQRLVVWCLISYIMSTADIMWDDVRFWCVMVLLLVLEWLAEIEGGVKGTDHLLSMPRAQLLKLKDFMDKVDAGDDTVTVDELNEILKKKEDQNADK